MASNNDGFGKVLMEIKSSAPTVFASMVKIDENRALEVVEAMPSNANIEKLTFTHNEMPADVATKMLDGLAEKGPYPDLKELSVSNNRFGDKVIPSIINLIDKCPNLENLNISFNGLTDVGVKEIAKYFMNNDKISSIDLTCNSITNNGATPFLMILKHPASKLSKLGLGMTNVSRDLQDKILAATSKKKSVLNAPKIKVPNYGPSRGGR